MTALALASHATQSTALGRPPTWPKADFCGFWWVRTTLAVAQCGSSHCRTVGRRTTATTQPGRSPGNVGTARFDPERTIVYLLGRRKPPLAPVLDLAPQ